MSRQKEELEAEVRGQLKRQAAAHSEHLSDMLARRELEVTKAWQAKLFDDIVKEKDRHLREIAGVKGKVQGLKVGDYELQFDVKDSPGEIGHCNL